MATIINQLSGSPLIGSPIVYQIKAGSFDNPVFHRVKVQVVAGLQGGDYQPLESSSPVTEGETLRFDVSSALQAIADSYAYTAEPPASYPYIQYYLVVWDEYLLNGVAKQGPKDYFPDNYQQSPLRALIGAYSDMERLLAGETKQAQRFSRKPTTIPEVVAVGETFVRAVPFGSPVHSGNITRGQQSQVFTVRESNLLRADNAATMTFAAANVYAVPAGDRDRYQLRFINGLGCMESVSVRTLRSTDVNITTTQQTLARQETFGTFSHGIAYKQNDYETWRMTSGPLDEAWQAWYLHEFLMAKWMWIAIPASGDTPVWVPCHVLPDDTVPGISREATSMLKVDFSIQLDINGSPLYSLAI